MRAGVAGLLAAAAFGLPDVAAELAGLGSWSMLPFLAGLLALATGGVALLLLPFRWTRARAGRTLVFCATAVVSTIAFMRLSGEARDFAFVRLAERSQPLVEAIGRYESAHGRPPYIDGDSHNAILVLVTDESGTIVSVDADRLPLELEPQPFDPTRWKDPAQRMAMVRPLVASLAPVGKRLSSVRNVLGPPNGSRALRDASRELRVQCPIGMLNWDVFVSGRAGPTRSTCAAARSSGSGAGPTCTSECGSQPIARVSARADALPKRSCNRRTPG